MQENFYFANEDYKELYVNFIRIESICDYCSAFLQSHFALYRQIKSGYNILERVIVAEIDLNPLFAKLILYFTAKLSA